ncbi:MAG TPA: DUF4384 domain-containing protein [Pyrinomonadaceae bacterium]|jgi:hypothetical protein|nr:DUF4384 domain-containing protein [Pyrinomonadaceae bacterium]
MKIKAIFFSFVIALAGFVPARIFAQQNDDVRGAFLTTRPKATVAKGTKSGPTTKPNRRRPKTITPNTAAANPDAKNTTKAPEKLNTPRMGLGLTLFMRDSNGLAVRTDPSHQFRKGDHVRLLIETNADGYLYVFNTTDGGQPVMIYPDPELDDAGNYFQAHVPFEIPSSVAAEERLRWLTFDEHAGAEKLYFVFTREPLAAVPMEDDLISYCRENDGKCPWHPGTEVWAQIQKEISEPVQVAKAQGLGSAQTSVEHRAATRGIGLNRDDPEPSLIMLTASTSKNMLVVALDLIHNSISSLGNADEEVQ